MSQAGGVVRWFKQREDRWGKTGLGILHESQDERSGVNHWIVKMARVRHQS